MDLDLENTMAVACNLSDSAGNDIKGISDLTNKQTLEFRYDNNTYKHIYPYVEKHFPTHTYWHSWREDSRIEKAFKLVQKLMDKKFVKAPKTVKDFIVLVNTLADEL